MAAKKSKEERAPVKPLTDQQRAILQECEKQLKNGRMAFHLLGLALKQIREEALHRELFKKFDDYCRLRWGWSKTHVNRLIAAAEVVENLTPIGVKWLPVNEAQARVLTRLTDPDQQREAWRKVLLVAGQDPITAGLIEEKVRELLPRKGTVLTRRLSLTTDDVETAAKRVFQFYTSEQIDSFIEQLQRLQRHSMTGDLVVTT